MGRKRGERRWGDEEEPYVLSITLPRPVRGALKHLTVQETTIGNFEVSDRNGNMWEVIVGCDDELEMINEPDQLYPNMKARILRAVREHQK